VGQVAGQTVLHAHVHLIPATPATWPTPPEGPGT
jgi:diadenosine tetraphosphate (Ap4A) HIT family hydrolase